MKKNTDPNRWGQLPASALHSVQVEYEDGHVAVTSIRAESIAAALRIADQNDEGWLDHGDPVSVTFVGYRKEDR